MLEIAPGVEIGDDELRFVTSRASGPGGQNVNKVETRVSVLFDVDGSPSLDEETKTRLRERLSTRISRAGVLRVTCQRHRTQAANREGAVARFVELLASALREEAPRRPTRVPRAAKRRRVEAKRRRGALKAERSAPASDDV